MPAHQSLQLEDDCGIENGREQSVKPHEDQPVGVLQSEPRGGVLSVGGGAKTVSDPFNRG
jgi:hypothetical protein